LINCAVDLFLLQRTSVRGTKVQKSRNGNFLSAVPSLLSAYGQ